MADPTPPTQGTPPAGKGQLSVPDDVQKKFPEIVALVKGSESMNDEERQYWINILPVMTPDQLKSLMDILENEKKQLQAIDEKYSKEMERIGQSEFLRQANEQHQERRKSLQSTEEAHKKEEEQRTEDILRAIDQTGIPQ